VQEDRNIIELGLWTQCGPFSDTVLSTRVRLARNIGGIPFPYRLGAEEADLIIPLIEKYERHAYGDNSRMIRLRDLDRHGKRFLRERNIITFEMEISDKSAVLYDEHDDFSILINEEDHLRIQVIRSGLRLREVHEKADRIDDEINRFVPYAFSRDYGYLTTSPSNLGTGMKISVMIHLPALSIKKATGALSAQFQNSGINISGTIGESNRALGGIYQLSNRVSLGMSELDIIELLDGAVSRVICAEDEARDDLFSRSRIELEDSIWRSVGLLSSARRMSYVEAIEHLSNVRLGIILAVIRNLDLITINNMMISVKVAHLQKAFNRVFQEPLKEMRFAPSSLE
jgi:protein arginine kinase